MVEDYFRQELNVQLNKLVHVANEFRDRFEKPPSRNIVVLAVVKEFHCTATTMRI